MEQRLRPVEIMVVSPSFWRGRRVFLTGHTGFKGSWLSLWLQHLGADVTGYALAPVTTPNLFDLADISSGMKSILGDIRDRDALTNALADSNPEIVIHMAAQALVRPSYSDPVGTFDTNVMGTVNLFEAVRAAKSVRAIVNVTSDKCYENREREAAYREDEAMGGHDPYSASKGCAELVTAAYRNSFFANSGVSVASARAGNVIGGGDLVGGQADPRYHKGVWARPACPNSQPGRHPPLAACAGALGGYLPIGQKTI